MMSKNREGAHRRGEHQTAPVACPVIRFEGGAADVLWKHPCVSVPDGALLLVREAQEAILLVNGCALDLYGPGRYALGADWGRLSRVDSSLPVQAEVYFVNRAERMALKWGTNSKVEYIDPVDRFPVQIGASGEMSLRVENSRQLLVKLAGLRPLYTEDDLTRPFHAMLMSHVKTGLARAICSAAIGVFELDAYLAPLSRELEALLRPAYAGYGISLERLDISTVVKPEEDEAYQLVRRQRGWTAAGGAYTRADAGEDRPAGAAPHCTRCSAALPFGARFCPACGEATSAAAARCPACGKTVPEGSFCMHCGVYLGASPEASREACPEGAER